MEDSRFELADFKQRAFATIIDYFLLGIFHVWFLIQFGIKDQLPDGRPFYNIEGPLSLVPFIVWFITFPLMESYEGRTVGKIALSIKVIREDGTPPDFITSLKRRICDWIDFAFLGLPAIIISTNNPLRRRLGDWWAKTLIIKDRAVTGSG